MTTENSEGMKDASTLNIIHVSRKLSQCMYITDPYAGHVVKVTFGIHCNAYDLFSNTSGFLPVFSIVGKICYILMTISH